MSYTFFQHIVAGFTSRTVGIFVCGTRRFIFRTANRLRHTGISGPPFLTLQTLIGSGAESFTIRHTTVSYTFFKAFIAGFTCTAVGIFIGGTGFFIFFTTGLGRITFLAGPPLFTYTYVTAHCPVNAFRFR